jgi:hypothetical protein
MQQWFTYMNDLRGRIFSHVRPFYELAVSNLDRPMHGSLWVWVTHSTFIEGLHMTKNTASDCILVSFFLILIPNWTS